MTVVEWYQILLSDGIRYCRRRVSDTVDEEYLSDNLMVLIYARRCFNTEEAPMEGGKDRFSIGASAYFFMSEPFGVTSRTA